MFYLFYVHCASILEKLGTCDVTEVVKVRKFLCFAVTFVFVPKPVLIQILRSKQSFYHDFLNLEHVQKNCILTKYIKPWGKSWIFDFLAQNLFHKSYNRLNYQKKHTFS